jgi:hypothetical protein
MSIQAPTPSALGRTARRVALVAFATLLAAGPALAQERPRSQADSRDPEARGTTRQTVRPGQAPSSRREPSRVREDDATPKVQNRAPEVIAPLPQPLPAPAAGAR